MATSYRQLTSQQKQRIVEAFAGGLECRQIPSYLDVSIRSVSRVLAEAGINTKRRNRYTLNEGYFDEIDSHAKAYLLGLMAADGCVTSTNYVVLESIDRELVEYLKSELKYSGQIRVIKPPGGHALHYRINFSSSRLAIALSRYSVTVGRTESGVYYFPKLKYLASYILGYFDGDGCAYVNKGRSGGLVCIVGSFEFASKLVKLLDMGVVVPHENKKVYDWRIYSRTHIQYFYEFIYRHAAFCLNRKKEKIEQIITSYRYG